MTPQAQEPAGTPGEWYERFGSIYTARTDGGEDWVCTFGAPREKPQLTQVEMANGKRIASVPAMERDLARLRSENAGLVAALEAAKQESTRLDWLLAFDGVIGEEEYSSGDGEIRKYFRIRGQEYSGRTWRDAIDAALAASGR